MNYKRIVAIDKDTGEVLSNALLGSNEELILDTKKKLTDKQKGFLKNRNEFKTLSNHLGGYVHMIYCKNDILFNRINIDKANISRIIYLATYLDYNNRNEGQLVIKKHNNKIVPMDRITVKSVLKLNDSTFKRFLKDMKENNLLYETDKKFFINTEYFNKGNINGLPKDSSYCRLFISTIQDLYDISKTSKHKVLANVFQLIPYIHYSSNIICHNPNCNEDEICSMSLEEIGKLLNISDDKGNLSKFKRELESFIINIDGRDCRIFKHVRLTDGNFFVVNPYVIYSGDNVEQLRSIMDTYFFRDER